MTMTWVAFEDALSGHRDPTEALDALTTSSMEDLQAALDRIGADEAGHLLAQTPTADSQARLAKLAAGLGIIDLHLSVGRVRKLALFGTRYSWADHDPNGDTIRSAHLASLIDSALGGEPEKLRTRVAATAAWWDRAITADLNDLSKEDGGPFDRDFNRRRPVARLGFHRGGDRSAR